MLRCILARDLPENSVEPARWFCAKFEDEKGRRIQIACDKELPLASSFAEGHEYQITVEEIIKAAAKEIA
jgi:hypothetical protein